MSFEINTDILTLINESVKFETRKGVNFLVKSYMFFVFFETKIFTYANMKIYIHIYTENFREKI